jgi:hypothetical protein
MSRKVSTWRSRTATVALCHSDLRATARPVSGIGVGISVIVAETLGISTATLKRDWEFARTWLVSQLR